MDFETTLTPHALRCLHLVHGAFTAELAAHADRLAAETATLARLRGAGRA